MNSGRLDVAAIDVIADTIRRNIASAPGDPSLHSLPGNSACNLHCVNFAIDEFALNFTGAERQHSFHYSTSFNFEKNDLLRIKRFSYQEAIKNFQESFIVLMLRQLYFELNADTFTLRAVVKEEKMADSRSRWELVTSQDWINVVHIMNLSRTREVLPGSTKWLQKRFMWVTADGRELK